MGFLGKIFTSKEKKHSAAAPVIVAYKAGQAQWMTRDYDRFSKEAYVKNVIAHACIKMVAQGCGSIPFTLTSQDKDVKDHVLLKLLNRPNALQARSEFIEAVISYYLIAGNSYIEGVSSTGIRDAEVAPDKSPVLELYALRPDKMRIIPAPTALPASYEYTNGSQKVNFLVDKVTGNSQILHLKSFHPLNDWFGLSSIDPAAYSIDQHNAAGAWNQSLLQNGARPSGALIVKTESGSLTDEQFNRLDSQLSEKYTSSKNSGRPMILEGGMEWKEMSLSPKDMDFLEMKNSSARDIALSFGVPPMLLGIPGDNTYSNMQEARLALWEDTIMPMFDHLVGELNHWLAPRFGNGLVLGYDADKINALSLRRKEKWETAQQADFITTNEKREMVGYGNAPQDGGNIVLVDGSKVPLSQAGQAQLRQGAKPDSKEGLIAALRKCGMDEEEIQRQATRCYGE